MTREKKLEAIESMGIRWQDDCPCEHGLSEYCGGVESGLNKCLLCWINALEATP
jgi:hypothetical protein